MYRNMLFTSESVTEGHPDKLCDQVSDAVLDAYLAADPYSRVACECAATTGLLMVMGEISSKAAVNVNDIARGVIRDIGYTVGDSGFDADSCCVMVTLDRQSGDIAMGVDTALEVRAEQGEDLGAGDQGMVFGFACDETPELMPLPIALAHRLNRKLAEVRREGTVNYLRPDGKAQVTVAYDGDGNPCGVPTVVLSTQHSADVAIETLRRDMEELVIREAIPAEMLSNEARLFINPTGRFVIGGPQGDSGLTGRKIIVDTYGGYARHGGGAFSGKDPTKVDRSAAYAARHMAKNIVAAGLAKRCEIQIAYAIGVAHPVSLMVDTYGTGILPDGELAKKAGALFDMRPSAIIKRLDLRKPHYRLTAAYGHFGRTDVELPWERLDMVTELKHIK